MSTAINIISHRGVWQSPDEKNSRRAFDRAFQLSLGIEFDIRDRNGELVVAHDLAGPEDMLLADFLDAYARFGNSVTLAINIKSDGLQEKLGEALIKFGVKSYFVFDMSVPDLLIYRRKNIIYFTRQSEYEPTPAAYEGARGVWLDQFETDWVDRETIERHTGAGKDVCVVSPELHGRDHRSAWQKYRAAVVDGLPSNGSVYLCTDLVHDALEYFRR
jgi:hypothetical protein